MDEWVLVLTLLLISYSYSCPPLSASTSVSLKRHRWAPGPPVSLSHCRTHQCYNCRPVTITVNREKCHFRWRGIIEKNRVIPTSCASSHRSLFSSIRRLLTVCTKFWKKGRKCVSDVICLQSLSTETSYSKYSTNTFQESTLLLKNYIAYTAKKSL